MIDIKQFKDNEILVPIVEKINKFINKNKLDKVRKLIDELGNLLEDQELRVPITYILSIIAENEISLINNKIIEQIIKFLDSTDEKIIINSIIIVGFSLLANPNEFKAIAARFVRFIKNENEDIRDNAHYFLQSLFEKKIFNPCKYKNVLIESLKLEKSEANLDLLVNYLLVCKNYIFSELYDLKNVINRLFMNFGAKDEELTKKLIKLSKKLFLSLKELDLDNFQLSKKESFIKNIDIMVKHVIPIKNEGYLSKLINRIKNSKNKDKEIFFYVKNADRKQIILYEVEKEKLLTFFSKKKISISDVLERYGNILENDIEAKNFVKILLKLKYIEGFLSDLGNFYPTNHMKELIISELQNKGILDFSRFNYLPSDLISRLIKELKEDLKFELLRTKDQDKLFLLKSIIEKISEDALKNNIIDLSEYRKILYEKDFIKLIKNLPSDLLSGKKKGIYWLTNLGVLKIKTEIDNSKILGYFSIPEVSRRLKIPKILIVDVLKDYLDARSGIYDNSREVFYYSRYINKKLKKISLIKDENEKEKQVKLLAKELNIDESILLTRLNRNLKIIGEEIKQMDEIKIDDYLEKTGMNEKAFFKFIENLGLNYYKNGDYLILKEEKINAVKKEVISNIIKRADKIGFARFSDFDITPHLIEKELASMIKNSDIYGIIYNSEKGAEYYSIKGIKDLMLENSFLFSFHDLFPGKNLTKEEINLLKEVLNDLIKKKILKGEFDENTLTFSSYDVIFAQDYNKVVEDFGKLINSFENIFEYEFNKIKWILTKEDYNISPQEIGEIQNSIDRINEQYVRWRNEVERFVRRANEELLKKQGYTYKKYKIMKKDILERDDIKLFEEDMEVQDLLNRFNNWIKLFNELELKYGNVIYYKKRLFNNPDDNETRFKLNELYKLLKLK